MKTQTTHTPTPWFISTKYDALWKSYGHQGTIIAAHHLQDGMPYYQDAYIGDIQSKEDAAFIVKAVNAHMELVAYLAADHKGWGHPDGCSGCVLLSKVEGK